VANGLSACQSDAMHCRCMLATRHSNNVMHPLLNCFVDENQCLLSYRPCRPLVFTFSRLVPVSIQLSLQLVLYRQNVRKETEMGRIRKSPAIYRPVIRLYVCMSVCLSVCSLISLERLRRSPPNFQGSSRAPLQ